MLGSKASALMARAVTKLAKQMHGAGMKKTVNVILRRRIRIKSAGERVRRVPVNVPLGPFTPVGLTLFDHRDPKSSRNLRL
jgi:hypothetical protein